MSHQLSDFFGVNNPGCDRDCAKNKKLTNKFLVNGICSNVVSGFDQDNVRCVKTWASEKIFILERYFNIFSTGMKKYWEGKINYVEICSGPGICIDRDTNKEILGTALAIASQPGFEYVKQAVFVDLNKVVVETLNRRFSNLGISHKATAIEGDYYCPTAILKDIKPLINTAGLTLVFIDPTDCSIPFDSVKRLLLGLGKKTDLIINFAFGMDARRNIKLAFDEPYSRVRKKYSDFLGSRDFFGSDICKEMTENGQLDELHRQFVDFYIGQLEEIGYIYTGYKPIRHYYELLFATSNETGMKFWNEAISRELHGDRKLF